MIPAARWRPGGHHGLVWDRGAALLEASVGTSVLDAVWRRLHSGPIDLSGFLTALGGATGSDLLHLPDFAVALTAGETTHVAARGRFVVEGDGSRCSGEGVTTWSEARLHAPSEVTLSTAGSSSGDFAYVVLGGTVPADAVTFRLPAGDTPSPEPPEGVHHDETPLPSTGSAPLWGDLTILGRRSVTDGSGASASAEAAAEPALAEAAAPDPDVTRFGDGPVSDEAGNDTDVTDPGHAPAAAPAGQRRLPPPLLGRRPVAAVDGEDDTVIRRPPVPAGPRPHPGSTRVHACVCPSGHANPPTLRVCGVCGAPLPLTTREVLRPSLGRLLVSDGSTVDLVGPVVIGRDPSALRFQGTTAPRLLKLSHAHVSANHAEIQLQDWAVLAVDLRSTNGTYVRRSGHPPVKLTEDPVALAPGDVLDLGHGVEITFEEPR